jgi:hypothetical protein
MSSKGWVLGPGAVAVGGNAGGPITVNIVNGTADLLPNAIFEQAGLEDALDLARFTGREWLIGRIDDYIARHRRG